MQYPPDGEFNRDYKKNSFVNLPNKRYTLVMWISLNDINFDEAANSPYLVPTQDNGGGDGEFGPDFVPHAVPVRRRGTIPPMSAALSMGQLNAPRVQVPYGQTPQ